MDIYTLPVDEVILNNNTKFLNEFFTDNMEKELYLYRKIIQVIPVEVYKKYEKKLFDFQKKHIIIYTLHRVDKRYKLKFEYLNNYYLFYILLLIFKNTSIYKSSSAIEVPVILKEFNFIDYDDIKISLDFLHHKRIITWEGKGLNQIRFKNTVICKN